MNDEVVDDVRRGREGYAAEFDFDLQRIADDLLRREKASGAKYLEFAPKKPEALSAVAGKS